MRFLVAALIALLPATPLEAGETRKYVDLDQPGAIAALRAQNPDHFATATMLIQAAQDVPCPSKETIAAAGADPLEIRLCAVMLQTSYPAKRRIRFSLGDTSYGVTVELTPKEAMTKANVQR